MESDHQTIVGDHCLLMANAHVAHDCRLGDYVIVTNNAMLAGHVIVGDRAYISGAVGVHQFCRVGELAMVGGQAHIVKDVPPFVTVDGQSSYVVGLNQIGLRRAGCDLRAVEQLKAAYRVIYRSGLMWAEILERLKEEFREGWPPTSIPSWPPPSAASFPSGGCRQAPPSSCKPPRKSSRGCACERDRPGVDRGV